MIRVLFVCHGNICRSPMAEFIMKDMLIKRGISDKFYVEKRNNKILVNFSKTIAITRQDLPGMMKSLKSSHKPRF